MTGNDLHAFRLRLGLTRTELGRLFGLGGDPHNIRATILRYERRRKQPLPPRIQDRFRLLEDKQR